ncbi:MAG: sugar isomerase domain-containing protein [Candidatus Hydrogenedentes bacterium]|nr:sugar isomerase domain-containing protein [Candidatus Hydrogenedentota bacterium]
MYMEDYFDAVEGVFRAIRQTQRKSIEKAARAVAASLAKKGVVAVMDTGHMLRHEAFMRAGGLLALTPFQYELHLDNPISHRPDNGTAADAAGREARLIDLALDSSKMTRGDVIILNSNSGRTANVIETALQCRKRGIKTIGIASVAQMEGCEAAHPSGKKLLDVADIFVDNCGPFGDAAVDVKKNEKMCPMSGLAATYILWAIQADAVDCLQEEGVNPTIYRSVHVGSHAFVEKQQAIYRKKGI